MSPGVFAYWPNRITALRFVGSLVLFAILSCWGERVGESKFYSGICFWLFIAIAATDYLDGYLARRGNQITSFGRIADPFVDKVLIIGAMVYLAVLEWSQHWFPAWVVVVVVAREFLVTGIRGYVESQGLAFPADWFGKIKMIVQCIAIGIALGIHAFAWPAPLRGFLEVAAYVSVYATLVTTVGSGTSYVFKTARMLGKGAAA
ncbi:MAG: CDP-diacylglycerol--glycerol-3-phosphate 3-phosphatidyltransferase [Planctomycetes bacterium]|nr:CDP-diacylglycerol--glycerol-3-phosphate 3-phosphatidyltransferase [Planctomycetota bacterium]